MNRRGGLGRGLAALIPPGEVGAPGTRAALAELPIDAIQPNPRQPRGVFDEDELEGLATSIRDIGVLQPIVVRPLGEDIYELVAGERRLRASKRAGLELIPAVVRHTDDGQLLKEALVENIHRVQLNPLEEAAAYQQLLEDFDFTQEELAAALGKSRPAISNSLRLLALPEEVQRRVAAGVLTAGHAKALLALPDAGTMDRLATKTVTEGLSVRALEELIRLTLLEPSTTPREKRSSRSNLNAPGLVELQDDLSDALMARVRIQMGARKGKLQVEFRSVDDLERIVGVIARGLDGDGEEGNGAVDPTAARQAHAPPARPVTDAQAEVEDTDLDPDLDLDADENPRPSTPEPGPEGGWSSDRPGSQRDVSDDIEDLDLDEVDLAADPAATEDPDGPPEEHATEEPEASPRGPAADPFGLARETRSDPYGLGGP